MQRTDSRPHRAETENRSLEHQFSRLTIFDHHAEEIELAELILEPDELEEFRTWWNNPSIPEGTDIFS